MQKHIAAIAEKGHVAVRIELKRPLAGHQGTISVIELKEPTLGDYIDCGPTVRRVAHDPRVAGELRVEIVEDTAALMSWATRLSGQPEAVLRTLSPADGRAVLSEVGRLVAEFDQGNSPSAPTSSSSSTA
jgi:hypothetical protein